MAPPRPFPSASAHKEHLPVRLLSAAILSLMASGCAFGQSYTIQTFAGGGLPVNIPGTQAGLRSIGLVAVDRAGNVFFTDPSNNIVLRLDGTTRGVSLVAGNGTPGFSGDNGPAVSAQLYYPGGVEVDAAGNLYIADSGNYRIRKVANGIITTVAGNAGGIAVDAVGNLYIADDNSISEVSNGIITTVAGNGTYGYSGDNGPATSAQLSTPCGVALDSAGNLYIADCGNYRIRKVANGVITTVAGTGTPGFSGDNGLATSAQLSYPSSVALDSAGNLYIADPDNDRIRRVSNGVIATVAGNGACCFIGDNGPATSAQLYSPSGAAVDAAGDLYIADTNNHRVRKVSNGVITTVAGTGTVGFGGDNGLATSAQLGYPQGVAVDSAGNLYIADNGSVRKVSNGVITTVAGGGDVFGDNGPATSALVAPAGVAVDVAGNLYIADPTDQCIRKVSGGVITTVAGICQIPVCAGIGGGCPDKPNGGYSGDNGPAISALLSSPEAVTVDGAGNLYIADTGNGRIRKVSNGVITTVAGGGSLFFENGPATSTELSPHGIALDAAGNLYIADGISSVRKVSNGVITTVAGNGTQGYSGDDGPATSAQFDFPTSVDLDPAGNIYVADVYNDRIRVLVPSAAGPFLSIAAVTNAASNLAGAISPGEIVAIYGSGMGPAQLVTAVPGSNGFYGTQLANTSVSFNGVPAPMIYTWATQVAAIVPYEITGTTAQVTVTYQGQTSAAFSWPTAYSAPGIFSLDSTGQGQAAAINQDGVTVNSAATPAKIGDIISLYATGEGQTTPAGVDGKPASVPYPKPNLPVTAYVGAYNATVIYAGGAPGMVAGLMQVNVQIPAGIQAGSAVPVALLVGDVSSQGGVTIAVTDPAIPVLTQLSPTHAPAGSSPVTLVVTGNNFQDNAVCPALCGFACPARSVISFDQTDIPTQFVSPAQVQGVVPASLLATARSVEVMVNNPVVIQCQVTDNHLSNGLSFTIDP